MSFALNRIALKSVNPWHNFGKVADLSISRIPLLFCRRANAKVASSDWSVSRASPSLLSINCEAKSWGPATSCPVVKCIGRNR